MSQWVFHSAKWGGLTVSVMPKSDGVSKVWDSNVGIVLEGPQRLLGAVVTKAGTGKPDCDVGALCEALGDHQAALEILGRPGSSTCTHGR